MQAVVLTHPDLALARRCFRPSAGDTRARLPVPIRVLGDPRHVGVRHTAGGVDIGVGVVVGVAGLQVAFVVHAAGCELPLVCEHASLSIRKTDSSAGDVQEKYSHSAL